MDRNARWHRLKCARTVAAMILEAVRPRQKTWPKGKLRTRLWWRFIATPFRNVIPSESPVRCAQPAGGAIMPKPRGKLSGLPVINDRAAAIDIGSRFHVVAVPPELCDEPVQSFEAFTVDLERMADWFVKLGVTTVAMESTGVYWVPVFEVIEARGIVAVVANAREARMVPGR